jgi:hypothetical protein
MPHYSTFTLLDYSNEKSTVTIHNGVITAGTIAGFLTAFGALRTAIDAITIGTVNKEKWVGDDTVLSNTLPTNVFAQRELKALVLYEGDTSQKKFTVEIPTFDPTGRLVAGTDLIDLTQTEVAAFVTAFESIAKSPDDATETVTILEMRLVGRNV